MPRVVALYRYPVKGFTPEACDSLTVLDEGRVAGDRVFGFRFANSSAVPDAWCSKHEFVALVNTPGLARLHLRFDHNTLRLTILVSGEELVDEVLVDEAPDGIGRLKIAAAIENYVLGLDDNVLASHPERLPLQLVGNGIAPRYQDNAAGQITLHGRASLAAVGAAIGDDRLSERRFRSNIVIDGLDAWEEQSWIGHSIQIGRVEFDVVAAKTRCLATQANPDSGQRDLPVLKTLTHAFSQEKPTFAVGMLTRGPGGEIFVGDKVRLLD